MIELGYKQEIHGPSPRMTMKIRMTDFVRSFYDKSI